MFKLQNPKKHQAPIPNEPLSIGYCPFDALYEKMNWGLEIGISMDLGVWALGFFSTDIEPRGNSWRRPGGWLSETRRLFFDDFEQAFGQFEVAPFIAAELVEVGFG